MESVRHEYRNAPSAGTRTFVIFAGLGGLFLFIAALPLFTPDMSLVVSLVFGSASCLVIGIGWWMKRRIDHDRAPKLILTRDSLHAPDATQRPIPWERIDKIIMVRQRPQKPGYIAIDVKGDLAPFEPKRATQRMSKVNEFLGGGEIIVQTVHFDETHEQIRDAVLSVAPDTPMEFR